MDWNDDTLKEIYLIKIWSLQNKRMAFFSSHDLIPLDFYIQNYFYIMVKVWRESIFEYSPS